MLDLDVVQNLSLMSWLRTSLIPSVDMPTENPSSTWNISESPLDVRPRNVEKLATSLQVLLNVVKSVLLDFAEQLGVKLLTIV